MKALKCEICGSNDIVKRGDYFVCESCGVKYTAEDVRKIVVEGPIEVDHSGEANNMKTLADRARNQGDFQTAEDYYQRAIELAPNDWYTLFYKTSCHCHSYNKLDAPLAIKHMRMNLPTVFKLADDLIAKENGLTIVEQIIGEVVSLTKMLGNESVAYASQHLNQQDLGDHIANCYKEASNLLLLSTDLIEEHYGEADDLELSILGFCLSMANANQSEEVVSRILEINPNYESSNKADNKKITSYKRRHGIEKRRLFGFLK